MKKAQISVEYIIILSITLAMVIGAAYVFISYTQTSKAQVTNSQINNIGNSIIQNAESIYTFGNGSRIVIDINYPRDIKEIYVADQQELVIVSDSEAGISESVFFSDIKIDGVIIRDANSKYIGNIQEGKAFVQIESKGDLVLINSS